MKRGIKRKITSYFESQEQKGAEDLTHTCQKVIKVCNNFMFKSTCGDGLKVDYGILFNQAVADHIYELLELEINYDEKSVVKIFGKTFNVPRKQTAFGNTGLTYTFSGVTVPAKPWYKTLRELKEIVESTCGCTFNFCLVNRYNDGSDYMGEHQDNEKDLDAEAPIASLSFGQCRDFIFKHSSSRSGSKASTNKTVSCVKYNLSHGSLLVMSTPTNMNWYHSLPKRSINRCPNPRINLTFRKMKTCSG